MSSLIAARDSVNDPTWQTFSFPYVITSAMNFSRQVQSQLLTSSNSLEIDFVVWMLVPKNILKITELWMICSEMAAGRIVFLVMAMDSVMTCGNKAYSSIILHKTSCWLLCSMLTIQLKKEKLDILWTQAISVLLIHFYWQSFSCSCFYANIIPIKKLFTCIM